MPTQDNTMKGKVKRMIPGTKHSVGDVIDVTPWLITGGYVEVIPEKVAKDKPSDSK